MMLDIPDIGVDRSVTVDKVKLDVLCDWIEASVLFSEVRLSQRDIVDVLCESRIYDDQEMATNRVANAWSELRRRQSFIGNGSPYEFDGLALKLKCDPWRGNVAHAFCVLLSIAKWYRTWARQFGSDYTLQGELFEALTRESLAAQFPDWTIRRTGWSKCSPKKLDSVVEEVAGWLGERKGNVRKWSKTSANDAGLDLVCLRSFPDDRPGRPVFLFRCASGGDWDGKLHTPSLELWRRLIEFTAMGLPVKAFATPFAFLDEDFAQSCNLVNGLLMDRYRLLAACKTKATWLSPQLARQIVKWAKPRLRKLPMLEE